MPFVPEKQKPQTAGHGGLATFRWLSISVLYAVHPNRFQGHDVLSNFGLEVGRGVWMCMCAGYFFVFVSYFVRYLVPLADEYEVTWELGVLIWTW